MSIGNTRVERYINFGSRSLARKHCATCCETTLHKYDRCIHCTKESERVKAQPTKGPVTGQQ